MKIAVTSTEKSIDSNVDLRFGRCRYFAIYDTELKIYEFIVNNAKRQEENAAITAADILVENNVKKVISGDFGLNAKVVLNKKKIGMIIVNDKNKTVEQVINSYINK